MVFIYTLLSIIMIRSTLWTVTVWFLRIHLWQLQVLFVITDRSDSIESLSFTFIDATMGFNTQFYNFIRLYLDVRNSILFSMSAAQ